MATCLILRQPSTGRSIFGSSEALWARFQGTDLPASNVAGNNPWEKSMGFPKSMAKKQWEKLHHDSLRHGVDHGFAPRLGPAVRKPGGCGSSEMLKFTNKNMMEYT